MFMTPPHTRNLLSLQFAQICIGSLFPAHLLFNTFGISNPFHATSAGGEGGGWRRKAADGGTKSGIVTILTILGARVCKKDHILLSDSFG
jgi:hypothetical protein